MSRVVRDGVAKLGLTAPAVWAYGVAAGARPWTIAANVRLRRRGAPDNLPIPPSDLIFLVSGSTDISWFLRGGSLAETSIREALLASHQQIEDLGAILDFGCGCGRVLRRWRALARTNVYGTDHNPKLVDWCRTNLTFASVSENQLHPPLRYEEASFDLVYALSVFTHLTEDLQIPWMNELARVLKPGGHVIFSAHGESYLPRLNRDEARLFSAGELVVKNNVRAPGSNACSAYHPLAYVRDHLAGSLDLTAFVREGAKGNPVQDLYILSKPSPSLP